MRRTVLASIAALAIVGCGGSSRSTIDITKKSSAPIGIQGKIIAIASTTLTVKGQLLSGKNATASGPTVSRQVKVWSAAANGVQVGDAVYLSTSRAGGFAQDKARDARSGAGQTSCSNVDTTLLRFANDSEKALKGTGNVDVGTLNVDVTDAIQALRTIQPKANATQREQLAAAIGVLTTLESSTTGTDINTDAQVIGIALGTPAVKSLPSLTSAICGG